MSIWPALPIAVPLAVAALLAAWNRRIPRPLADTIAIASAAFSAAVSLLLMTASNHRFIVAWMGGWTPRLNPLGHAGPPLATGISLVIDPFGAGLAAFAGLLVAGALVFSLHYFDSIGTLYHVLMLAYLAAMCGFSLTGDLFNLFVWFELMSATAFALCGYKTEEPGPVQGALNFAVTNTVGAFFVLSGIGLIYGRAGALNIAQLGAALAARGGRPDGLVTIAFTLILCGFLTKAAVVPFHFWLADAHAVAPTPVCALLSGIMVELGLYGVARVYWTIFAAPLGAGLDHLRLVLVALGGLTAVMGAIMCFVQRHLKRLLAFSTVSHMGLMLIGFGLLTPSALAGIRLHGAGLHRAFLFARGRQPPRLRFSGPARLRLAGVTRRRPPGDRPAAAADPVR